MRIIIIDNSIDFNGKSLNLKAIDSFQKNLIYFSEALFERKHEVFVYNNTTSEEKVSGVNWKNYSKIENTNPKCDILIVMQDPDLLNIKISAKLKYFWLIRPLIEKEYKNTLIKLLKGKFEILFENHSIIDMLPHTFQKLPKHYFQTGVLKDYFSVKYLNYSKANALVTAHPLRGVEWLIDLWCNFIYDKIPWAELHIYSNLLSQERLSKNIKIRNLQLKILSKKNTGIVLKKPVSQIKFLGILSNYRVHLNPSVNNEAQLNTILESQASGIPVVSRINNSIYNCLYDNETGYITNNENKFAKKTIEILTNKNLFVNLSNNCRLNTNIKLWSDVALDFERKVNENFIHR